MVSGPGDMPIYQVTATGTPLYLHQDHLGSTRLVTNTDGSSRGTQTYDTSGRTLTNTNPWLQEQAIPGFASQYRDNETGYTYLRNRYYDPGGHAQCHRAKLNAPPRIPLQRPRHPPVHHPQPTGRDGLRRIREHKLQLCRWKPGQSCHSERNDNFQ